MYVKDSYEMIMENKEEPEINYEYLEKYLNNDVEEYFYSLIKRKREEEIRRGTNLVGPHRDDYNFNINSLELKKYGSQGQHKTFQIALRFAQFFYLKERMRKLPIFLMDDVFGELDAFRASKISEHLKDIGQAFITLTDLSDFSQLKKTDTDCLIQVKNGVAVYA